MNIPLERELKRQGKVKVEVLSLGLRIVRNTMLKRKEVKDEKEEHPYEA
tara:strand:- start:374 stop:520 length:147 start_codon:yes stop_codon:yes gene_type:complete